MLEFDPAGNLLRRWGGPGEGYDWPQSNHGLTIDHKDNVWIGGNVGTDSHILKFTQDGKFLAQYGKPQPKPTGSNDTENFGRVAKIFVDPRANEAYIADGYGNKRVAVLDGDTGKFKRYWGAYGNKPDDVNLGAVRSGRAAGAAVPHARSLRGSVERRPGLRLRPPEQPAPGLHAGKASSSRKRSSSRRRCGDGAVWDVAFSKDPEQKYLYLADGKNERVYILLRDTLEILSTFGGGGRQPGQFFAVHSIATDSKGNLYTTETYQGRRLQKFVFKGVTQVPRDQGATWPVK